VVKRGKSDTGKQPYRCQNPEWSHQSFLLDPAYPGRLPEITQRAIEMSLNGRGVRDTARVLKMSTATVIHALNKKASTHRRQPAILKRLTPERCGPHQPSG
jgi:transposase-like protein